MIARDWSILHPGSYVTYQGRVYEVTVRDDAPPTVGGPPTLVLRYAGAARIPPGARDVVVNAADPAVHPNIWAAPPH